MGCPTALRKGCWTQEEDSLLRKYVEEFGEENWKHIAAKSGLRRCRKSCRLRWLNYLRPNIKRGNFGADEDDLIMRLHRLLGNRWSMIAGRIPGRTPNEIKNYWKSYLSKKIASETNKNSVPVKHRTQSSAMDAERMGSASERKQGKEEEEEEDTVAFWRRLLSEAEYKENFVWQ
ncbi:hypothetical protein AAG906_031407 [Vitis piasezkii]